MLGDTLKTTYHVDDYITLKLEKGVTNIYVCGEYFNKCKYLLINIPVENVGDYDKFEYMDDVIKYSEKHNNMSEPRAYRLKPEEEFWGHCSNLQAWADNGYDLRILDTSLSIPIIRKIMKTLVRNKANFFNFFNKIVQSLDEHYQHTQPRISNFSFLARAFFLENDFFTKEQLFASKFLRMEKGLLAKKGEKLLYQQINRKLNYYERKIWGLDLEYRHFLRDIRNKEPGMEISHPLDYLPYLYAKGEFVETEGLSYLYIDGYIRVVRDNNGKYHIKKLQNGVDYET